MNKDKMTLLHLLLVDGVGPATINKIISGLDCSSDVEVSNRPKLQLQDLYHLSVEDLIVRFGIRPGSAQAVFTGLHDCQALDAEIKKCQNSGVAIVSIFDDEYPSLLRSINVPPPILFVKGSLPSNDEIKLAVVGARRADPYGKMAVKMVLPQIVEQGWVIVSGGATGIDSAAHRAALDFGGKTVVVTGCGFDFVYPESNKPLFQEVVERGGCLISIFPSTTAPDKGTFPARNRVIAGMSVGTLVVQAAKESGSLITAKFAIEENREVLAVPGAIDSKLGEGCNVLIKQGAYLVSSALDVFSAFEFSAVAASRFSESIAQLSISDLNPEPAPVEIGGARGQVLRALVVPSSHDELSSITGISSQDLIDLLFELELEGLVVQHFNGTWERSQKGGI